MAHTIGTIPARSTVQTGNPITFSQAVLAGETVFVLLLKVVGATDRVGGAPSWNGQAFTQASTTQKAATSPEAGCELWYLLNPLPGTFTLTIPNTGALSRRPARLSRRRTATSSWQLRLGAGRT